MTYKTALGVCQLEEEWFLSFKGTPYEDIAYDLLDDLYSIQLEHDSFDNVLADKNQELSKLEYQLKKLQLDALRSAPIGKEIIVVHANKRAWFGDSAELQTYIDSFVGTPQESDAIKLVKEYLDIKEDIDKFDEDSSDFYKRENEVKDKMEDLSTEALQSNIDAKIPTTGLEAFPSMAGELAELMDGVSLDTPLEPFTFLASKKALEEVEPVEKRIIEIDTEGIDPAEIPEEDRLDFQKGDKVTLTKTLEVETIGGIPHKFEKGTKGEISSNFDGQGHVFMVKFDDGGLVMVPSDHLK